jgi:hypothetical protein
VLVLKKARLVFLANPKTATQSVRAVLGPFAGATPDGTANKHINARVYERKWSTDVSRIVGAIPETFAVMREPVEHMGSWFRYRQRDALRGHENSTQGLTFAEFAEARLSPSPPPFARIGRQDRFLGFLDGDTPVNHIFDYAQIDRLVAFLSERLETPVSLPSRNVSPKSGQGELTLPDDLMARLHDVHATEFALYARVQSAGVLYTAPHVSAKGP